MKLFVTIELDIETPLVVNGAPPATTDSLLNQLRIHTGMVARNFDGKIVRFTVEKA